MAKETSIKRKLNSYLKEYEKRACHDNFFCEDEVNNEKVFIPINGYFYASDSELEKGLVKQEVKQRLEKPGFVSLSKTNELDEKIIQRFHPDNIDTNIFWEKLIKTFKFSPIIQPNVGGLLPTTPEDINKASLSGIHIASGTAPRLLSIIKDSNRTAKILEIGAGYGCIPYFLEKELGEPYQNYYGIDVNLLFEHPHLYKCDGKNIPTEIPYGMDVVYSVNVFQHLSKKQRSSYYRQIFSVLKPGGKFIFSMFIETMQNRYETCWGFKDTKGRNYTQFFGQFTEVDREEELIQELTSVGFEIGVLHNSHINHKFLELTKPVTEEI